MSDKLLRQIVIEREQLNHLIDVHRSLLNDCVSRVPSDIELSALAFLLHSFYSGIENIFKRIAIELDDEMPKGNAWHRQLLDEMRSESGQRKGVISSSLYDTLSEYLAFRHVFRQSYSFHLQWEKMSGLVLNCERTLRQLEVELQIFLGEAAQPAAE